MEKIAFITEMGFSGKIPRNHPNMRTEFAWMCALEADHFNFYSKQFIYDYDLVIWIIPKNLGNISEIKLGNNTVIDFLKSKNKQVAVMQEGPNWFFQDYSMEQQIWYYNTLCSANIIYCHNNQDKQYFEGLTNHKDVRVLQSLMIEGAIPELPQVKRSGIIIGGNMCSWYGGFDSFMVASSIEEKTTAPSMGRKIKNEEQLLSHLPYQTWSEWIISLNTFKFGVHLMRTQAAGTFALNCAYLGIPCIGYEGLDTQEILHPNLTVKVGDLKTAKKYLKLLYENPHYYQSQSEVAKEHYNLYYDESVFISNFSKQK
jgi:hypothetical protein